MRFRSTKLTVLLLLTLLTFGFTLSTKAQAPEKDLTSWQSLPDKEATDHFFNDNLYASLIVGRATTIALSNFYCWTKCEDSCTASQKHKCDRTYKACLTKVKRAGQTGGSIGAGIGAGIGGAFGTALGGAIGGAIGTGIGGVLGYQAGKKTAQTSKRAECLYKREECFADFQWYTNCVASCKAAGLDDTNAAPSMKSMGGG